MKTCRLPIIAVIGNKNSGKTTVIEILTRELTKRGYKVAAVKHIPKRDFTIDVEGRDTWRFATAGAKTIVAISPMEITFIEKKDTSKLALEDIAGRCQESDLILIEGFRELVKDDIRVPKIVTVKTVDEAFKALKTFKRVIALAGFGSINETSLDVPYFNILKDGDRLSGFIEEFLGKLEDFEPYLRSGPKSLGLGDSIGEKGERRAAKKKSWFPKPFHSGPLL
jgi:molybdopterin-guanine dinucleotide biosynthesis protein B